MTMRQNGQKIPAPPDDPRGLMRHRRLLWTITLVCAAVLPSATLASPQAPVNQAATVGQETSTPSPSADLQQKVAELTERANKLEGQVNDLRLRPRDDRDVQVEQMPWRVVGLRRAAAQSKS